MKKYLFPALALGLVMTSCQSDEPFAPGEGGEKQVTFTLNVPGDLGTRADFGANKSGVSGVSNEGTANIKYTLVLDADGDKKILDNDDATINGKTATFSPTVVLGREYKITAYASLGDAWDGENAIDITKHFNDETKDAYFYTTTHNFAEGDLQPLALKRPFGKLRLLATDYKLDNSGVLNTAVKNVKITYNDAQVAEFDVFNSVFEFGGSFVNVDAQTFGYYGAEEDGAMPIFADYVPANPGDNMVDFTVEVTYTNDETYSRTFNDIPVKRNALTTLKGNFFTAGAEITVNVEDNFENEQLIEKRVTVTNAEALTDSIAAAKVNTIIYFANHIEGNATAIQKEGIDVIIDGRGFKYDGTITVDGAGRATGVEKLTFQNINFYTDKTTKFTFIDAPSKINGRHNYTHNVTIQDCTFESANPYTTVEIGSASFTGTYNFVMKNCTATKMHSILQTQSCDNTVLVENVKTVNCKNGVSFGNTAFPTLRNSTINAAEYGVRADGNASRGDLKIENTTVNAKKPVIVRKMTTNSYKVALNGADLQTAETYHVVFTKGDDEAAYEAPTGAFTISGADDYNVYPTNVGSLKVATNEQLKNAIAKANAGDTIYLLDGTYSGEIDLTGKNITLKADGNNVKFNGVVWADNCTATLEGIRLSNPNGVQSSHRGGLFDNVNERYPLVGAYNYANITFRSCIFDIVGPTTYGFFGYAHNDPKFYDCTFNCNGIRPIANNGKSIVVDGCVFVNQYHYSVRIYENSEETQDVVYTNNIVRGTNDKGEFEGINISKKAGTATIHANFTIKGNTSGLKYRHHSAVTMGSDCTYDTDIVNFAFEREQ